MGEFYLREVSDKKTNKEFLEFPARLYKDDKKWIRPLDEDVEKVFDPQQNKFFRTGNAIRWLLIDGAGITVGRMAAFYEILVAGSIFGVAWWTAFMNRFTICPIIFLITLLFSKNMVLGIILINIPITCH